VVGTRMVITVLFGALALDAAVHADMMPLSSLDTARGPQSPGAGIVRDLLPASPCTPFSDVGGLSDLDSLTVGSLLEPATEVGQSRETRPAQIVTDRQNSLTLCLYALFGLGLCRSAPFVKKLHVGCIPEWYHTGGPSQIGGSLAISPDCLPAAPVFCFIQPDGEAQDVASQYLSGTIAALLRKSQFTPPTLASRGPPARSHAS
jgi:hypothetical protein